MKFFKHKDGTCGLELLLKFGLRHHIKYIVVDCASHIDIKYYECEYKYLKYEF